MIHIALWYKAHLYLVRKCVKDQPARQGQVVVDTGGEGKPRGIREVIGHVMWFHQHGQPIAVRDDVAAEVPFLPQNAIEQPVIDMRRHAVNFVVRGHHAAHARLFHCSFKGNKKVFPDDPL